jgi:serine/threonine protein kinase
MSSPTLTASSAMANGTRLGEFEITGVVGEGGFGIVYSARDSSLDRIVAIKEYLPSAFASRNELGIVHVRSAEHSKTFDAGLASFINEARMLAKFSHPGLVEVFRFWEANGTAYMAMRYYRGLTLREVLRTNPQIVTEQWLCETLDPILLALQELHHEKCYHRDIAPDNILVLPNGRSVLMDFGAARRIIGGMTRALTTVLKPGYAPIEQYSDDGSMAQGAWTDVYAVGGLLYHAMTGKVPVQAISRMMNDPLKPVAVAARGDFSPNLCAVVMKCLAVMPENRYQSVDDLRAALGWVTTPVSSTVVYQRTVMVPNAADTNSGVTHSVPSQTPAITRNTGNTAEQGPRSGQPSGASALLDSTVSGLGVATPAGLAPTDPLASLLASGPSHSSAASSPTVAAVPPSVDRPQARDPSLMPKIIIGIAAVAVAAFAAYWLLGPAKGDVAAKGSLAPAAPASSAESGRPVAAPAERAAAPSGTAPQDAAKAPVMTPAEPVRAPDAPTAATATGAAATDAAPNADGAPALGKVDLRIKPWGTITVNGIAKGASPPTMQLQLPPGTYTIEIQNPAGPTVTKTVEVVTGKPVTVRHSF